MITIEKFIHLNKLKFIGVNAQLKVDGTKKFDFKDTEYYAGWKINTYEDCVSKYDIRKETGNFNQFMIDFSKCDNYMVIDTDDQNSFETLVKYLQDNNIYNGDCITDSYRGRTLQIPYKRHFWFKIDEQNMRSLNVLRHKNPDIDIFPANGACQIAEFSDSGLDVLNMPVLKYSNYEEILIQLGITKNIIEMEHNDNTNTNNNGEWTSDMCEEYFLKILSAHRAANNDDWLKAGFVLKQIDEYNFNIFDKFSKRSAEHYTNTNEIRQRWKGFPSEYKSGGVSIGTILHWGKEDNLEAHNAFKEKYLHNAKILSEFDKIYIPIKEEIEQTWCKLLNPVLYVRLYNNDVQLRSIRDTAEFFKNKNFEIITRSDDKKKPIVKKYNFFDIWRADPNIKTKESIIFQPNLSKADPKDYNLFTGFKYASTRKGKLAAEFKKVIDFIFVTEQNIIYFFSWVSHIINFPWIKTGKVIVLYSEIHGAGKNSVCELLIKLFAKYASKVKSIDDFLDRFNANLCNRLFTYGDEITAKASDLANELKNVITQSEIILEKKGVDKIVMLDYNNYMFTTNNEVTFKIELGDRRYFLVEVIGKLDPQDYNDFYMAMEDEVKMEELFNYIKNYDEEKLIKNINTKLPPMTPYKTRLIGEKLPAHIQYIYREAANLSNNIIKARTLFVQTKEYAKKHNLSQSYTETKFGNDISFIRKERKRDGLYYIFPDRKTLLQLLKTHDEMYYYVMGCENIEINDDAEEASTFLYNI
jgi:hypothetical protein